MAFQFSKISFYLQEKTPTDLSEGIEVTLTSVTVDEILTVVIFALIFKLTHDRNVCQPVSFNLRYHWRHFCDMWHWRNPQDCLPVEYIFGLHPRNVKNNLRDSEIGRYRFYRRVSADKTFA